MLAGLKGKIILSINDLPEMRAAFKQFKLKSVSLKYTVNKNQGKEGNELLIYNF